MLYYMVAECNVSIIGGGFKPPHLGHLTMIFRGVSENNITVLAVGSGNRDGITRRLSKDILKVYLDNLKHQEILEYEETLFGFIILNKKVPVAVETGAAETGAAESGGERADLSADDFASIKKVYHHLQSVLMGVSPEELLDSLIMDELHVETIQSLIDRVTKDGETKNVFIEKKSKSPIGLTFYLFQILEEYVKVDETLSLRYYVGEKDFVARQKIFSRFIKSSNPYFEPVVVKNTKASGERPEVPMSGTETRNLLKDIDNEPDFSNQLFSPLLNHHENIGGYNFSPPMEDEEIQANIFTVTQSVMKSMKNTTDEVLEIFKSQRLKLWLERAKRIVNSRENSISSTVLSSLGGKIYATSRGGDGSLAQTITSDEDIFNMLLGGSEPGGGGSAATPMILGGPNQEVVQPPL